jgi:hypothetical protein
MTPLLSEDAEDRRGSRRKRRSRRARNEANIHAPAPERKSPGHSMSRDALLRRFAQRMASRAGFSPPHPAAERACDAPGPIGGLKPTLLADGLLAHRSRRRKCAGLLRCHHVHGEAPIGEKMRQPPPPSLGDQFRQQVGWASAHQIPLRNAMSCAGSIGGLKPTLLANGCYLLMADPLLDRGKTCRATLSGPRGLADRSGDRDAHRHIRALALQQSRCSAP